MNKLTPPNLISGLRLLLSLPSAFYICQQQWAMAAIILSIAVSTDLIDGWLARRRGQTTAFGGLLDHASDAIFVTATLAALATLEMVPTALPALVAIAFVQYVLDSNALAGRPLKTSLLGRYNGIAYFILAGLPIGQEALKLNLIPMTWILWIGWALVISTLVSITDRLIALTKLRQPDQGPQ